jgi:glucan phosphoethanolaminetransferase (alkaline phosphatase superfamily)
MKSEFIKPSSPDDAPEPKTVQSFWPWVMIVLIGLTLPNLVAAFVPRADPLGLLMLGHGLGLIMLPCLFGLSVRRWLTLLVPISLTVPLCIIYLLHTKTLPNTFCYLALLESDAQELSCFQSQGVNAALLAIPLFLLILWIVRKKIPADYRLNSVGMALTLAGSLSMLPYGVIKMGPTLSAAQLSLSFTQGVFPFGTMIAAKEAFDFRGQIDQRKTVGENIQVTIDKPSSPSSENPEVNVLVIGESARAASFQINGYARPTTPRLSEMEGLIPFKDVVAAAPITLAAVPQMLTPAAPGQFLETLNLPSIPAVYRKAGYKVYWISAQTKHGVYDTTTSTFSADADESIFLGGKLDSQNMGATSKAQDWQLLGPFCEILKKREKKVLIILHMMGSHGPAALRYPVELGQFPVDGETYSRAVMKNDLNTIEYQNMINAYDNSIWATDWFLGEVVKNLKKQNSTSWLYYISDHGENLSGMSAFTHGTLTLDVLKIPLFVWTSPQFQMAWPARVHSLNRNAEQKVSARSTFHTVLGLSGISCDGFDEKRSLASEQFELGARQVSSLSGQVYDFDREILPEAEKRPGGWKPLSQKKEKTVATALGER